MKFENVVEKLQNENLEYVILIKCGVFYQAIGNDALILERELNAFKICFKTGICKIGIPKEKLEPTLQILKNKGYKYIVYHYIKGDKLSIEEKYIEIKRNDIGKNNKEILKKDCENCKYNKRIQKRQNMNKEEYEQEKIKEFENNNIVTTIETNKISKAEQIHALLIKDFIDKLLDKYIKGEIKL